MRRNFLYTTLTAAVMMPAVLFAAPVDAINKDGKSLALKGFDAVAYFTESRPVEGSAQFTHRWMDGTWRFSSAANRDLFAADPAKYAPQFGGYCAWAVSNNHTAPIDPQAWKVVDGKLYLNYSKGVQAKWSKDIPARISAGEKNWPALHK